MIPYLIAFLILLCLTAVVIAVDGVPPYDEPPRR
jgi:hypothetical protein